MIYSRSIYMITLNGNRRYLQENRQDEEITTKKYVCEIKIVI